MAVWPSGRNHINKVTLRRARLVLRCDHLPVYNLGM